MKQKLALIGIGLAVIAALLLWESVKDRNVSGSEEGYVNGIDGKITRAELAKMISQLVYTREETEKLDRVIIYEDTTADKWYDKYINSIYKMGLLSEEASWAKEYHPMEYVTFSQLLAVINQMILQRSMDGEDMSAVSEELYAKIEEMQGSKSDEAYITRLKWLEIYEILYTKVYPCEVQEQSLYILETWEKDEALEKWQVVSNQGTYYGDGINFIPYEESVIRVLVKGDEVVCITALSEKEEAVLSNAWIVSEQQGQLHIFIGGVEKTYPLAGETKEQLGAKVADIVLLNNEAVRVTVKPDVITGRILQEGEDYVEIEGYGKIELSENFCIYKIYDGLELEPVKAILVGYSNTEFVLENNKICAAIIKEPVEAENIRVLIKTSGFQDVLHSEVKLTADCDFTIICGDGDKTKSYEKGKKVTIKPDSALFKNGRIFVKPEESDGKITLLSIKRNELSPSYRGTIELALRDDGITIVNELSIEEYLYAVIPSEMPTSYGTEALKVQAICARSYAYRQLLANSCSDYGAHVDDSYSYQVYNNIPENEVSIAAVKETYGKVLQYNGEIITAYYFSTSCGHTSSANEVWNSEEPVPYLTGKLQTKENSGEALDLSKEEVFKSFLTEDICETYEEEMAWYRWSVTVSAKELKKSIDKNLGTRYKANPKLIQTMQEDGSYLSVPVDTVGKVEEIQITGRKTGGIITEIVIKGSENTVKVMTEYNIRTLLAPEGSAIVRQDKSKVENLTMLPSAFFVLEEREKEGKFNGYKIIGGGYGHGVGMSQNGAKAMVDAGKSCEEVLKHFYQGVEIGVIYNDWNCNH